MFSTLQDVHHIQFFLAQLALVLIHHPGVNFINIFCARFLYKTLFRQLFSSYYKYVKCFEMMFVQKIRSFNVDEIDGSPRACGLDCYYNYSPPCYYWSWKIDSQLCIQFLLGHNLTLVPDPNYTSGQWDCFTP